MTLLPLVHPWMRKNRRFPLLIVAAVLTFGLGVGRDAAAGGLAGEGRASGALDDPAAMPGGLIVAGANPGYLKYNGGRAVYLSGPDDPETFLYLGTLNPDGTRAGGKQSEIISRMADLRVTAFHCLIFRMQRCNIRPNQRGHVLTLDKPRR